MEGLINSSIYFPWRRDVKLIPTEVGDYSLFVNANLEGIRTLILFTPLGRTYTANEIIYSSEGSIVYFKECISNEVKPGVEYDVHISNRTMDYFYMMPWPEHIKSYSF